MSRSNPTLTNPSRHFIEWVGSKGQLSWYNKEKKENIPIKIPFEFMVLDELATIKGFSKRLNNSYYSNEVRSIMKEEFIVKVAGNVIQTGLYKDLADVRAKGAKYTKSIYIAHKVGTEYIIDNFNAGGSALSAWIEFSQNNVVTNGKVRLTGSTHVPAANGISEYYIPTFEYVSASPEENEVAIALDKELQIYLNQYLAVAQFDRATQDDVQVQDKATQDRFNTNVSEEDVARVQASNPMATEDVVIEDLDPEEPINLDDIPF